MKAPATSNFIVAVMCSRFQVWNELDVSEKGGSGRSRVSAHLKCLRVEGRMDNEIEPVWTKILGLL